ncbi:hypothetical protein [Streptomyces sp. NPDC017230]|uniref:hypothetical protein n=1 Tax=unclassified Streptomyces TaxID=2593676 RepID=UPI0037B031FB
MDEAALPVAASRGLIGTDTEGKAYIAVAGKEDSYLVDSRGALRALIAEIKTGKADHLL